MLFVVKKSRLEFRYTIGLAGFKHQSFVHPFGFEDLAHQPIFSRIGHCDHFSMRIIHEQIGIYCIQIIDILKNISYSPGLRRANIVLIENIAKCGGESPPATIVSAFVQVAIHNIYRKGSLKQNIFQDGRNYSLVQVADRAFENLLCAFSCRRNIPQQHF